MKSQTHRIESSGTGQNSLQTLIFFKHASLAANNVKNRFKKKVVIKLSVKKHCSRWKWGGSGDVVKHF